MIVLSRGYGATFINKTGKAPVKFIYVGVGRHIDY